MTPENRYFKNFSHQSNVKSLLITFPSADGRIIDECVLKRWIDVRLLFEVCEAAEVNVLDGVVYFLQRCRVGLKEQFFILAESCSTLA